MTTLTNEQRAALLELARPSPTFKPPLRALIRTGGKSQTRRVIPDAPPEATSAGVFTAPGKPYNGEWQWLSGDPRDADTWQAIGDGFRCPYGVPGTIWYLREPLRESSDATTYADADPEDPERSQYLLRDGEIHYWGWKRDRLPQIHMPKWAARTFLRVEDVRVQRLQEIGSEDAAAEGVTFATDDQLREAGLFNALRHQRPLLHGLKFATVGAFAVLWESIHGRGAWALNPWLFAYTFRLLTAADINSLLAEVSHA